MASNDMANIEETKQIMKHVNDKIKDKKITDRSMDTLKSYIIDTISKMDETDNRRKTTIGIFGKSGEGKSSLLNAILGEEALIPSGSSGACTAVITQVEANLSDSNYTAEIELISEEEWEKELRDLFEVLSNESEDRDEDMITIAIEKITALYGEDAHKKTLEELKILGTYAEINGILSTSNKTISTFSASDFANDVACYIQHSESSPGGWYWPLVKSVTIKIPNCHELLEHIVLVDLPGTGDCNKTRDDLWRSKLRECSSVWVVSSINRATTDKGPWEMLKHCIEELGPAGECKSINFICTKTDDINSKAYCRPNRLPDTTPAAECIVHRNDCTKKKMKEKFERLNPGVKKLMEKFSIDVFTVSSKAFFEQNLILEKTETEIPKLQDVLKNLNKRINRELARDYINEAKGVLSLIQSFQPNTDEEMGQEKARFHDDLKKNLSMALKELDRQFAALHNTLDQCLSKGVEESVERCLETAKTEVIERQTDNRGYHKILKALCKNEGHYRSKNLKVTLDLNKSLASHMKNNINEEFCLIFPVEAKTGKSVQEQLDKFRIIQSENTYPRSSMFHHIQNFIKSQETKLKASCCNEVRKQKKEIYKSIETTIQEQMAESYKQAAKLKGKGCFNKMQNILTGKIESLKEEMFNEAKMEVLERFNKLKLYIMGYLETELNKSMDLFLLKTSLLNVSKEIEELEKLSEELSERGAESSSEHLTSQDTEMFVPEIDQVDNGDKIFRFMSPHAGQFRCSLTNLVFVMEGKGELRYKIVPWDSCLLDGLGQMQPAGPLYNIECFKVKFEEISQLHLPHCEIMSEENKDIGKINVAHFTDGNVEMLQPLKVTDTHVITGITELSLFGLIKKIIFPASPVCAQVLLFLRPITVAQNQKILNVHLLPGNVPLSEVQSRHQEKKYIETSSICHLIPGTQYRLCCHPEECEVQPPDEEFRCNFGPNYHTTFEVFLDVSIEEVRLGLLDKTEERTEVWKLRRVPLPAPSQDVEFSADRRFPESEFVDTNSDKLIQRVTSAMEMADWLKSKDMITSEMYNKVHAAEPRQEKMRIIFDVLESGGASVKAEFYRLLKQKEPYLVDELESGPN